MSSIPTEAWFHHLTGQHEASWRLDPFNLWYVRGTLVLKNSITHETYRAGTFETPTIGDLWTQFRSNPQAQRDPIPFIIVTRERAEHVKYVDVAYNQARPEHRGDTFQVASNFNGLEAIDVSSYPSEPTFVTDYLHDRTQGPTASISAGPAAIARMYGAFYRPDVQPREWSQTDTRQVNFLQAFENYIPVKNGYATLHQRVKVWDANMDRKIGRVLVGVHRGVQVTFGERKHGRFQVVSDPRQIIHQVFTAALNLAQGDTGRMNRNLERQNGFRRTRFILSSAYIGTYLAAIANRSRRVHLTLVGGGAFGNPIEHILSSMLTAHASLTRQKTRLKAAILSLYSPLSNVSDVVHQIKNMGHAMGIPVDHRHYGRS